MSRHRTFSFTLIALLCLCVATARGSWLQASVSNAAGTRSYKLWVPDAYDNRTAVPLVLMLHGCTQTPADFAAGTRMNAVADAHNFLVAYPEQPASANAYKCWNWFAPAHQARAAGEPSLLAAVVNDVRATHKIDPLRIYVAGMSAGGAMASIMVAAYPELFAGLAVCAGIEYKAAQGGAEAFAVQKSGGPDPIQQGAQAYQAMRTATRGTGNRRAARSPLRPVRVIVFQGTLDPAVRPINGEQVIAQWAQTNDLLDDARDNNSVDDRADNTTTGTAPNGYNYTRYIYTDGTGRSLLEKWLVQDMKHAWSGGAAAGSYTDPKGPNASAEIWRFFQQTTRPLPVRTSGRKRR